MQSITTSSFRSGPRRSRNYKNDHASRRVRLLRLRNRDKRALPAVALVLYNRSPRCLALNWSPLVGADSSPSNRRRDCAARRAAAPLSSCCIPCLRFNPLSQKGTVAHPLSIAHMEFLSVVFFVYYARAL